MSDEKKQGAFPKFDRVGLFFSIVGLVLTLVNLYFFIQQDKFQTSMRELELYGKVSELNQLLCNMTIATAQRQAYLNSVENKTAVMRRELDEYTHAFYVIAEQKYVLLNVPKFPSF